MVFSLFWDTVPFASIPPSEGPIGSTHQGPKNKLHVKFHNLSTTRIILCLNLSVDRAGQDPKTLT